MTKYEDAHVKAANVAEAKAHFSALLADAEGGEEIIIMRRGKPVARIVPEPACPPQPYGLSELRAFVEAKPCRAGLSVAELRKQDLL